MTGVTIYSAPLPEGPESRTMGLALRLSAIMSAAPLIFSATLVIIVITGILMCLVNLSERLLLGPADADADPDADQ